MKRKVKYDLTFKLNFVKEVLKDYRSENLSSREGFDESLLRKW